MIASVNPTSSTCFSQCKQSCHEDQDPTQSPAVSLLLTPSAAANEETNVISGSNSSSLIIFGLISVILMGLCLATVYWMKMRRKGVMERDANEDGMTQVIEAPKVGNK